MEPGGIKLESQNEPEAAALDSALGEEAARDCDNATSISELESNGYTEDSIDLEASQDQRDRICLEPIYDLYAISVSVSVITLSGSISKCWHAFSINGLNLVSLVHCSK